MRLNESPRAKWSINGRAGYSNQVYLTLTETCGFYRKQQRTLKDGPMEMAGLEMAFER